MRDVEAVEKVPSLQSGYGDGKIDLSECAVFDDRGLGKGQRTPKIVAFFQFRTSYTASLGFRTPMQHSRGCLAPSPHSTPHAGPHGALAALVDKHRDDLITSRLNEVYGHDREDSSLDAELALLQHRTLARGKR